MITPGTYVRCHYRQPASPYRRGDGSLHIGVVLALNDPRAWARTLAFSSDTPDPAAVTAHVASCLARGLLQDGRQPVLYDFGVRWDSQLHALTMRDRYRAAHREARLNARKGLWLENPVRVEDGYPGVFVGADGRPRRFAGFSSAPDLFPVANGGAL
jgi:hypothetical protein